MQKIKHKDFCSLTYQDMSKDRFQLLRPLLDQWHYHHQRFFYQAFYGTFIQASKLNKHNLL